MTDTRDLARKYADQYGRGSDQRVHDSIEWRYFRIGHVGTDKWPTARFIDLLRTSELVK